MTRDPLPLAPPELDALSRHCWYCDRLREAGVPFDPSAEVHELARIYCAAYPAVLASSNARPIADVISELRWSTLAEFANVDEPGADALLGEPGNALIPANGDVMLYGDGGAGKTTLAVDLACHLAAGDPWLGFPVARRATVALIENEGPRPQFRAKLRRKVDAWSGSAFDGFVLVLEEPWSTLSLAAPGYRESLASAVDLLALDVLIAGPLTRLGMDAAGTLQEVVAFAALIADVRARAGRPVAFVLVHHENKGGKVSGAWEGAGDTLLHVQGEGPGRTRVYVQKARWASAHHATTLHLVWTEGEGFEVEDRPEVSEDTIADNLLAAIREHPGASWETIRNLRDSDGNKRIRGNLQQLKDIRDRLIAHGVIVNTAPRENRFALWLADDPAAHRSEPGTTLERLPFPPPADGATSDRSVVPSYRGNDYGNDTTTEPEIHVEDDDEAAT